MQQSKTAGTTLTVIGGAVGIWVFTRFTSFAGQMHTWSPPFTEYETWTLIGAAIAIVLLVVGITNLIRKQPG